MIVENYMIILYKVIIQIKNIYGSNNLKKITKTVFLELFMGRQLMLYNLKKCIYLIL